MCLQVPRVSKETKASAALWERQETRVQSDLRGLLVRKELKEPAVLPALSEPLVPKVSVFSITLIHTGYAPSRLQICFFGAGGTGPAGAAGPKGDQGESGIQGSQGRVGATGPVGPIGTPGQSGAVGATGQKGQNGNNGLDGATGSTGQKGEVGNRGVYRSIYIPYTHQLILCRVTSALAVPLRKESVPLFLVEVGESACNHTVSMTTGTVAQEQL